MSYKRYDDFTLAVIEPHSEYYELYIECRSAHGGVTTENHKYDMSLNTKAVIMPKLHAFIDRQVTRPQ